MTRYVRQLDMAVASNPEIEELVHRLEEDQDDSGALGEDVPSGDAIARDFQRFLRQQSDEHEGPAGG